MPDFPQTISKGKHHVSIYAPTLSKARYRINYWIDGKRYQRNFVAYEEAKTQATRILNQLARNNRPGAALNLRDSEIYLRLKLATESRGFSIQEAIDLSLIHISEPTRPY